MFLYIIITWITIISAVHAREPINDEQLASGPLLRQLIERVSVLETRDRSQQNEITDMKAELTNQKEEINDMKTELNNQKEEINDMKIQLTNQKEDIQELRYSVAEKDCRIRKLINVITKQQTEHKAKISKVEDETPTDKNDTHGASRIRGASAIRGASRIRRFGNEVTVAFFSGLTQHIQHARENQNIVFDLVETNLGNGYNPQRGVFTAPVPGTYVFTTAIMTNSGRKICEMVVNGIQKAQVYTHGDGHYDQGSQTIIVQLKKGDDVGIQITEHHIDNTIHGEGIPYTTFSGFLLQQDYSQVGALVG